MTEQRIRELRAKNATLLERAEYPSIQSWSLQCPDVIALCDLALEALASRPVVQAAEELRASARWSPVQGCIVDNARMQAMSAALDAREGKEKPSEG